MRRSWAGAALAGLLVVAACSGDDGSSDAEGPDEPAGTTEPGLDAELAAVRAAFDDTIAYRTTIHSLGFEADLPESTGYLDVRQSVVGAFDEETGDGGAEGTSHLRQEGVGTQSAGVSARLVDGILWESTPEGWLGSDVDRVPGEGTAPTSLQFIAVDRLLAAFRDATTEVLEHERLARNVDVWRVLATLSPGEPQELTIRTRSDGTVREISWTDTMTGAEAMATVHALVGLLGDVDEVIATLGLSIDVVDDAPLPDPDGQPCTAPEPADAGGLTLRCPAAG